MIPHKVLSAEDYQELASKLIDDIDPENFIEQSEREYLSANRNFYTHLEKAVSAFYFPASEYEKLSRDLILLPPPDNEKTEKALALVKAYAEKSATKVFDVSRYQFELKHKRIEVTQAPGKVVHFVCCEDSIQYLKGLVPYVPSEKDFAIFENVFTDPHKLRKGGTLLQQVENPEKVNAIFQITEEALNQLSRPDLRAYFFECLEKELKLEVCKEVTGRQKFPIMQFVERLEDLKLKTLSESQPEPGLNEATQIANPDFTTARQVLAVHYLLEFCQVRGVDQTHKAKFAEFLTGKNYKNIYDLVRNPLTTKTGSFRRNDLKFIRPFFEDLGLVGIVKMIDNELSTKEE
jgi:hypothetical protein